MRTQSIPFIPMDKLIFTGKVANLEGSINDLKVKLDTNKKKLELAYDYKDNLYANMRSTDENIKKLQLECFQNVQEITDVVDKIKQEISIYAESVI